MFGTVTVERCAWRHKGLSSVHLTDAALSLPAGRHSHGLGRLAVTEAVRGPYDQAKAAIDRRCGKVLGKRQAERLVTEAARDIDAYYRQRMPLPATVGTLLVLQVEGKNIVMCPEALRPATLKAHRAARRALRTRLAPGEKPHRKRMATLACVFDADPAPRRPHDIIAPPAGRSPAPAPRPPAAAAKWLTGSVVHPPEDTIAAAFDQAEARDPGHLRTWVVLVDGARHQLDLIRAEAAGAMSRCTSCSTSCTSANTPGPPCTPSTRPAPCTAGYPIRARASPTAPPRPPAAQRPPRTGAACGWSSS
ncbi:hypothetical protein GCM10010358_81030 [Streptomyces minutiscleroticus]|uniref:Uncharacterized protein n=1 Tax=Streptomyces minutiscleroticus TaxID=68238 RepID=A0A918P352_9ACTN|nr:hypothetical protein [Streptomyces minutiscleroticus]GGY17320.1 hypothetical protein GCM10010358_81030 [Streptomyces minutiscleroticus]